MESLESMIAIQSASVSRWWFASFPRRKHRRRRQSERSSLRTRRCSWNDQSLSARDTTKRSLAWDLSRVLIPQPRNMFRTGRSQGLTVRTDEWLIEMSRRHDCAHVGSVMIYDYATGGWLISIKTRGRVLKDACSHYQAHCISKRLI